MSALLKWIDSPINPVSIDEAEPTKTYRDVLLTADSKHRLFVSNFMYKLQSTTSANELESATTLINLLGHDDQHGSSTTPQTKAA